jgi:hypothetical protein
MSVSKVEIPDILLNLPPQLKDWEDRLLPESDLEERFQHCPEDFQNAALRLMVTESWDLKFLLKALKLEREKRERRR